MEHTVDLIKEFYDGYLSDLHKWIKQTDQEIQFFGTFYIANINKHNEMGYLSGAIIAELKRIKEEYEDDIVRITARNKAHIRMVRWHKADIK